MSKPKAAALLAMDEAEFLVAIGPMVQSKPWKHILTCDSKGQHLCRKCGQTWPTQADRFSAGTHKTSITQTEAQMWVAEEKKIPREGCPVPDPITDPLPVVVEKLRKCNVDYSIFLDAIKLVREVLGHSSSAGLDWWFWWKATPKQQIVVLLVAMKKVEI